MTLIDREGEARTMVGRAEYQEKHLPRYLQEFELRRTTRKISDEERMAEVIGRHGRQAADL